MGIRISSVQSRDQVELKDMPVAKTELAQINEPVPPGMGREMREYADFIERKEAAALKNARNIRSAMVKNKFADFENSATMRVMEAQGENTFKAGDDAGKELRKNIEKELQKVPAEYRREYANFANDSIQRFNRSAQGRMITEGRRAGEEAFKKRAEDLTSRAVLSAYDLNEFEVALQDLDSTTDQHTQLTIGSDSLRAKELGEIHKREARSTTILKTVETLAASGDLDTAANIAQKYKDTLTASDTKGVYSALSKGREGQDLDEAKAQADQAFKIYQEQGERGAQAYLTQIGSGKLYKDAKTIFDGQVAADQRILNRERQDKVAGILDQVYTNFSQGKRDILTTEMLKALDPKDRAAVTKRASDIAQGKEVESDPGTQRYLYDMWSENPTKFRDVNLNDYRLKLNDSTIRRLEMLQKEVREPVTEKFKSRDVRHILSKYNQAVVISGTQPGTKRRQDELAQMQDIFSDAVAEAKADLGERGTSEEFERKVEEIMAKKTLRMKDQRTLWEKITFKPKEMAPVQSRVDKNSGMFNKNALPPALDAYYDNDIDAVKKHMTKKLGRDPKNEELLRGLSNLRDSGKIRTK